MNEGAVTTGAGGGERLWSPPLSPSPCPCPCSRPLLPIPALAPASSSPHLLRSHHHFLAETRGGSWGFMLLQVRSPQPGRPGPRLGTDRWNRDVGGGCSRERAHSGCRVSRRLCRKGPTRGEVNRIRTPESLPPQILHGFNLGMHLRMTGWRAGRGPQCRCEEGLGWKG